MKHIYQIGNIPLHLHAVKNLAHEPEHKTSLKSSTLLRSPEVIFPSGGQYLYDTVEIEIEGYLEPHGRRRGEETLQALNALINVPTDIIAYDMITGNGGCACVCPPGTELIWLYNTGWLKEVSPKPGNPGDPYTVTLSLEVQPFWEPINTFLWYFGSQPDDPFFIYDLDFTGGYKPHLAPLPNSTALFQGTQSAAYMWVKRNLNDLMFLYDPSSWAVQHSLPSETGKGSDWSGQQWYVFNIDALTWAAPPRILYAFDGLPNSGQVVLRLQRENLWTRKEETTTIDLDQLDDDLDSAGFTGLLQTDRVVLGNVYPLPALVIRSDQILDVTFDRNTFQYSTAIPGQLYPGLNRLYVDLPQTPPAGRFAYNITYRRL